MSPLTPEQLAAITHYLDRLPRLTPPLKEELLDHLCCAVEDQLARGASFADALAQVQGLMNENEVDEIIHSLPKNRSKMIQALLGVLTISLTGFLFPWPAATPPSVVPDTAECPISELPALMPPLVVDWAPPSHCPIDMGCTEDRTSSGFGMRIHPVTNEEVLHRGIDWRAPLGTPVYAAGPGHVMQAGQNGQYGNYIRLVHDDTYQTAYAHLSEVLVKVGDTVEAGDLIGRVGSSGASIGSHLHYEVIKNGSPVNPIAYLP